MIIIYPFSANKCMLKAATKTLEIKNIIQMKTYSKSNYQWYSIKKLFLNISQNSQENTCAKASFLIKLPEACSSIKMRLWQRCFSVNFYGIFKNIFFTEHLQVTASDNQMQVVVLYNLNLSLQFVGINVTFSLL